MSIANMIANGIIISACTLTLHCHCHQYTPTRDSVALLRYLQKAVANHLLD